MNLTHLDENNRPKMVDVSNKNNSTRIAVASGTISMSQEAFNNVISNNNKKGPVIQTAVISAIMAEWLSFTLSESVNPITPPTIIDIGNVYMFNTPFNPNMININNI